jgi:hypothetical protein
MPGRSTAGHFALANAFANCHLQHARADAQAQIDELADDADCVMAVPLQRRSRDAHAMRAGVYRQANADGPNQPQRRRARNGRPSNGRPFRSFKQDPASASPATAFPSDRQARGRAAAGRRVRREAQGRGRRAQRASLTDSAPRV